MERPRAHRRPSYYALRKPGLLALLGTLRAKILARPQAGSRCVVAGWYRSHEGRKYHSGSALYAGDGTLLAAAHALWIELKNA